MTGTKTLLSDFYYYSFMTTALRNPTTQLGVSLTVASKKRSDEKNLNWMKINSSFMLSTIDPPNYLEDETTAQLPCTLSKWKIKELFYERLLNYNLFINWTCIFIKYVVGYMKSQTETSKCNRYRSTTYNRKKKNSKE